MTSALAKEKAKLKKSFSRADIFFLLVCSLVGLDTLGSVAAKGAQGFVWLIVLSLGFFVPYALLVAELGSAFPEQGGAYVWTKLAFGRRVAAIGAVFYWLSNPIWLGGSLAIVAMTACSTFLFELGPVGKYVFGLLFVWSSVLSATLSLGVGRWISTVGAWARVVLLGFFTFSVVLYALRHGVHGVVLPHFVPTYEGFVSLVPLLFFNFVGFELPSAGGEEMLDPKRDVPRAVMRSALTAVLCYGVPILAILVVLPQARITGLKGFIDAIQTVFTVYGGEVHTHADGSSVVVLTGAGRLLGGAAAMGFVGALATSGTTWMMGADRSQAVACLDGSGPRFLGRLSRRFGTPIPMNVSSGMVATVVMVVALALTSGSAEKLFAASLNLGISMTAISYLAIFPSLYLLRRRRPGTPRPYVVPGGARGALIISVVTTAWALFATLSLVWPGFATSGDWDAALPTGFVTVDAAGRVTSSDRLLFELTQIVPLVVAFLLGVAFLVIGEREAKRRPLFQALQALRTRREREAPKPLKDDRVAPFTMV